ncbi:hypothetical protein MZM54_00380 [[Brevibacterium] frigoritolerans]|nr:hypothetical protein [Peribacillus frigoritolerans]
MKPIIEQKELFKVEMWLVELYSILESDALLQPPDVKQNYLDKAKEIRTYLDNR